MRRWTIPILVAASLVGVYSVPQVASSSQDPKTESCTPQPLCGVQNAFDAAKKAGAEKKAPYEYYAAQEYLALAEKESHEADKPAVEEFAATAMKYAEQALSKAGGGAK